MENLNFDVFRAQIHKLTKISHTFLIQNTQVSPNLMYNLCKEFGLVEDFVDEGETRIVKLACFDADQFDQFKQNRLIRFGREMITLNYQYHRNKFHSYHVPAELSIASHPESSQHILNALNLDCLREVFRHLNRLDLPSVSKVCTLFNALAMERAVQNPTIRLMGRGESLWKWEEYLRVFGSCIRKVSIYGQYETLLVTVAECCDQIQELEVKQNTMIHSDFCILFLSFSLTSPICLLRC